MKSTRLDYVVLLVGSRALWQLLHWAVGSNVVSAPAATIERAVELLQTESFWVHVASTLSAFAMASVIGIAIGIVVGLWLGLATVRRRCRRSDPRARSILFPRSRSIR